METAIQGTHPGVIIFVIAVVVGIIIALNHG